MTDFVEKYLQQTIEILRSFDRNEIEAVATGLADIRGRGGAFLSLAQGEALVTHRMLPMIFVKSPELKRIARLIMFRS